MLELALRCLPDRGLGICQPIQADLTDGLLGIGRYQFSVERDGFRGRVDRQLISTCAPRGETRQQPLWTRIARIGPRPRLQGLSLSLHVAGDVAIVQRFNVEPLDVADTIAQSVRREQ